MMTRSINVEGIVSAICVFRLGYFKENLDPGLPNRTMAVRNAVLPVGGIVFGADNGWWWC
jgi:hypothetical protein